MQRRLLRGQDGRVHNLSACVHHLDQITDQDQAVVRLLIDGAHIREANKKEAA